MSRFILNDCVNNTPKVLIDTTKNNVIVGSNLYNVIKNNYNKCTVIGSDIQCTGNAQVQLGSGSTNIYTQDGIQQNIDNRDMSNIRDITLGLDFINKLHPVDYKWNCRRDYIIPNNDTEICNGILINKLQILTNNGTKTRSRYHHGLIGQDIQDLIKTSGKDFGGFQDHSINGGQSQLTIAYTELIAPMIKAIQELTTDITTLKTRISTLETKSTALETRATALETRATTLETKSTALETRATALETKSTALETRATALETKSTALETRATALETKSTALETRATALETKSTALETRATALETKSTALETRLTAIEKKLKF